MCLLGIYRLGVEDSGKTWLIYCWLVVGFRVVCERIESSIASFYRLIGLKSFFIDELNCLN